MDNEEILKIISDLDYDKCAIDKDGVYLHEYFYVTEDDEYGDIADQIIWGINCDLKEHGLYLEAEYDHDTVWGHVKEIKGE